jgi:hypothetical protein
MVPFVTVLLSSFLVLQEISKNQKVVEGVAYTPVTAVHHERQNQARPLGKNFFVCYLSVRTTVRKE